MEHPIQREDKVDNTSKTVDLHNEAVKNLAKISFMAGYRRCEAGDNIQAAIQWFEKHYK